MQRESQSSPGIMLSELIDHSRSCCMFMGMLVILLLTVVFGSSHVFILNVVKFKQENEQPCVLPSG